MATGGILRVIEKFTHLFTLPALYDGIFKAMTKCGHCRKRNNISMKNCCDYYKKETKMQKQPQRTRVSQTAQTYQNSIQTFAFMSGRGVATDQTCAINELKFILPSLSLCDFLCSTRLLG